MLMPSLLCDGIVEMAVQMEAKTYLELIEIPTFEGRFKYLQLNGVVGKATFGHDRYLNQILYTSGEWRSFRNEIIIRDNGCDLACEGFEINEPALIHHINPITVEDILNRDPKIFDPNNVITTVYNTHRAIHYGDLSMLPIEPVVRTKNDTCPWR